MGEEVERRQTLYAYVEGQVDDARASQLQARLCDFVDSETWPRERPCVVRQSRDENYGGERWVETELGLNLRLPPIGAEPPRWFEEVERIASFVARLGAEFDVDFVLGLGDEATGVAEDCFDVSGGVLDIAELRRAFLGDGPPS